MKTYKKHSALSQVEYSIDLSQLQLQIINSALSYVDKSIDQEETEVSINIIDVCTDIDYNIHNTARLVKVIKSLKDLKMIVDINNKCKIEKKDITLFKNLEVHGFKKGYITFDIPPSFARLNQYSGSSIYDIDTHLQFSSKRVSLLYDYIFDYKNLKQQHLILDIDVFKKILNITKPMTNIEFNRSLKTYANEIQTLTQLEIKFETKGFKIDISWKDDQPKKEKPIKKQPEEKKVTQEECPYRIEANKQADKMKSFTTTREAFVNFKIKDLKEKSKMEELKNNSWFGKIYKEEEKKHGGFGDNKLITWEGFGQTFVIKNDNNVFLWGDINCITTNTIEELQHFVEAGDIKMKVINCNISKADAPIYSKSIIGH